MMVDVDGVAQSFVFVRRSNGGLPKDGQEVAVLQSNNLRERAVKVGPLVHGDMFHRCPPQSSVGLIALPVFKLSSIALQTCTARIICAGDMSLIFSPRNTRTASRTPFGQWSAAVPRDIDVDGLFAAWPTALPNDDASAERSRSSSELSMTPSAPMARL